MPTLLPREALAISPGGSAHFCPLPCEAANNSQRALKRWRALVGNCCPKGSLPGGLKMNFSLTCSAIHSSPDASFHRVANAMDRKEPRQSVSGPAMITLGNRGSLPCRISNVSRSGAMVLISNSEWLPNTFELADSFSGVRRQATVVWKGARSIGVRFRSGSELAPRRHGADFGRRTV